MAVEFTVLCFGPARHEVGADTVTVTVENPMTVDDVIAVAADPATPTGLVQLLPHCAVAVDDTLVALDHPVRVGDELALLPPVAGG